MKNRNILKVATGVFAVMTITATVKANPAHDMISAASETKRQQALAGLLSSSGEKCGAVDRTFYQGSDKSGNAFWNASCRGGKSFVIQVNNDRQGSTRILDCKVLKAVNGGTCFTKFK